MIHRSKYSIGCIAIGNEGAEDLFILAAVVGREHVTVLITPVDFRVPGTQTPANDLPWVQSLYRTLARELGNFPLPPASTRQGTSHAHTHDPRRRTVPFRHR